MKPFTAHEGVGLPLRRSGVDTDQILPSKFLKRITRTGFEDALFSQWREDDDFILNDPTYANASVLVADSDFGIGSSREGAVWALQDYGFRAVIAPSFGDIFRVNAAKAGLLVLMLPKASVETLFNYLENYPGATIIVDLDVCRVVAGQVSESFEIDADVRWRLLNGIDEIEMTLAVELDIVAYEGCRSALKPNVALR